MTKMNYRISTRIIGILDLVISTIGLIAVGCFGVLIVGVTILQFGTIYSGSSTKASVYFYVSLVISFIVFFIALYCGYSNFMADWKLILSTIKEQNPQSAFKFSNLWVSISYWTLCLRVLILLLFFYYDFVYYDTLQQRYHVSYSSFLVFILFFIRVFQMYCVIKYRRQLKGRRSSDNIILRGSGRTEEVVSNCPIISARSIIIPIPPTIVANTNENGFGRSQMSTSTVDLPSYESAVFTKVNFYPPPPSYDSLYKTKDIKINVEDTPNYF